MGIYPLFQALIDRASKGLLFNGVYFTQFSRVISSKVIEIQTIRHFLFERYRVILAEIGGSAG